MREREAEREGEREKCFPSLCCLHYSSSLRYSLIAILRALLVYPTPGNPLPLSPHAPPSSALINVANYNIVMRKHKQRGKYVSGVCDIERHCVDMIIRLN